MNVSRRALLPALALAAACAAPVGCTVDLGTCDMTAATTVYYRLDVEGDVPAYAGQALIQRSCASGVTCHSAAATGPRRYGVPFGLDYDVGGTSAAVLRAGIGLVREDPGEIWKAVEADTMPPGGEAERLALDLSARVERSATEPLPEIRTAAAHEILRNWLACGAPIISQSPATCTGVAPDGIGDCVARRRMAVPRVHREAPVACPTARGPGTAMPGGGGDCDVDTECTTGPGTNGRCLVSMGGALINSCSYDDCTNDAECTRQVCDCRLDDASSAPNRCLGGECVVDSECGTGGYCSPSVAFDRVNYPFVGYFCHTSMDECVDDEDCSAMGTTARCAYDPSVNHWACSNQLFLPP